MRNSTASNRTIVTGACGLIGRATAEYLEARGHSVIRADLKLGCDLNDEVTVKKFFSSNPADSLVNLFAHNDHVLEKAHGESFLDVSLASFASFMSVNVTSLFSVCREFIRANDRGSIVNASSIYGVRSPRPKLYGGGEKHPGYGASKAAVIALTNHLAIHAAPNFRVNCLVIGGVESTQPDEFVRAYEEMTPLARMATVQDIPPMVEFLIGNSCPYITGAAIPVDGGWTA